jgi:hypothetical protein
MLTGAWIYAGGTASPDNQGIRVAYGPFGINEEFYGWGEFWASYREGGDQTITAVGASVLPVSFQHLRLGWGPLFNAGFEQRKQGTRAVLAGVIGIGPELVVRLSTRCDLAATAEFDYLTTLNFEYQARLAFRFHDERISLWKTP